MASAKATQNVKQEKLTQTKKYSTWVASGDLYALPASAVPGCGFLLGMLLKQEGITRANQLYDIYKKQKKNFPKYLACKFGPWNLVYANTVVKAFQDWEEAHTVKKEKKTKKVAEEKKKGPPRKVGEGSKKWTNFLMRSDLSKTSVRLVPGIASILGEEMCKRGYKTAQQLMDQFKGSKKGQCNGDEEAFKKWILCCFGYWNTQYSAAVIAALKAHSNPKAVKSQPLVQPAPVEPKQEPTEDNENQGQQFGQTDVKPASAAGSQKASETQDGAAAELALEAEGETTAAAEDNENQGQQFEGLNNNHSDDEDEDEDEDDNNDDDNEAERRWSGGGITL